MRFTVAFFSGLLFLCSLRAFGQDTVRIRHSAPMHKNDNEDTETEQPQKQNKRYVPHAGIGIEIGYNIGYLITASVFQDSRLGWCIGAFGYVPIVGHFVFQPSLYYTVTGGGQQEGFTGSYEQYIHSVDVPLVFGFRYGHKRTRWTSFVGIGPVVSYNLGGTYNNTSAHVSGNLHVGTDETDDIKPYNLSGALYIGSQISGFSVRVRAQYGLIDIAPHDINGTLSTFNYGVQIGYVFGKEDKRRRVHKRSQDDYLEPRI